MSAGETQAQHPPPWTGSKKNIKSKWVRRMERISIIDGFQPKNDPRLLSIAAGLAPRLRKKEVSPAAAFRPSGERIDLEELPRSSLGPGEELCLDFGTHWVGYVSLELSYQGSHPDAPAYLRLEFAETLEELQEDTRNYRGWISRSWLQEEQIHIDELPAKLCLPRRYAFRYLKLTVLDTSRKFRLRLLGAHCRAVTSAELDRPRPLDTGDPLLNAIDAVSLKTLSECMQDVFEDGPKRDRRLWLGDFRLQALTNYVSFRSLSLVKRCLYLFAGSRFPDGCIASCIFTRPEVAADDTCFPDYALLFLPTLEEYLQQSDDREALADLYAPAMEQLDLALAHCGGDGLVEEAYAQRFFIDWCEGLHRRACAQGVLIYTLDYGLLLARRRGDSARIEYLQAQRSRLETSARSEFWDGSCFRSGGQAALATQVWMVLADVLPPSEARELLLTFTQERSQQPMVSPYLHHYYLLALLHVGLREQALSHIRAYWGGMVQRGADTFWEIWDPRDPDASPYGGKAVNSYCHAWSCTPAYFLRTALFPQHEAGPQSIRERSSPWEHENKED